jgi:hypothetical protein
MSLKETNMKKTKRSLIRSLRELQRPRRRTSRPVREAIQPITSTGNKEDLVIWGYCGGGAPDKELKDIPQDAWDIALREFENEWWDYAVGEGYSYDEDEAFSISETLYDEALGFALLLKGDVREKPLPVEVEILYFNTNPQLIKYQGADFTLVMGVSGV